MRVLVVGGTGLLGSAIVEQTGGTPASRRTGYDFFKDDTGEFLDANDPDAVVVAATVEQSNVTRETYNEAVDEFVDACRGRRLVYVSSDAVFDGERGQYGPTDDPSPRDDYGRRLRAFENGVAGHEDTVVLRPSYIYSGDPLSPRLAAAREALAHGTYERFDDVYRSPAHATVVATAVDELARGDQTGVFHVPGQRLSIYEFHRRALDALGVPTDGLRATEVPDSMAVAADRSLRDPRFETELDAEIRPPEDVL